MENLLDPLELFLRFTGEVLRMTHIARGLDPDGSLLLDVVVSGYVLQLQSSAEVNVKVNHLKRLLQS